ncbi:hypothetical protein ACFQ68_16555 [Amycolatopsis japonica]|uniref:hypothetical protein n=1 Tax=Amycolatopsis japonica TaxID=208439 RepID=UPI003671749F
MSHTALTLQAINRMGAELVFGPVDASASPNGNSFATTGRELIVIKNADAATHTCTISVNPARAPDGPPNPDGVIAVPAGKPTSPARSPTLTDRPTETYTSTGTAARR